MKQNDINILVHDRLDLIVKILFIESYLEDKNYDFYEALYLKHIKLRVGSIEDNKNTWDDFIKSFKKLIESIQDTWFDASHAIGVNKKWSLSSGAHRLACCIYFDISPSLKIEDQEVQPWWYDWFKDNNFSLDERLKILRKYQELFWGKLIVWYHYHPDIPIDLLEQESCTVIAKENLTTKNLRHIIWDIYSYNDIMLNESIEEKISALESKRSSKISFSLVQWCWYKDLSEIKKQLRKWYHDREKYLLLHTPESDQENIHLSNIFLSYNNLQHVELRENSSYRKLFLQRLDVLFMVLGKYSLTHYCIVWSWVIEVFQKFNSSDIDIITLENERNAIKITDSPIRLDKDFDIVSKNYWIIPESELIHNPDYHFYFRGKKFINLKLLKTKKLSWIREKDVQQAQIIEHIINKWASLSLKKQIWGSIIPHIKYLYIKVKIRIIRYSISFTKKIGIYKWVSPFWRKYFLRK